MRFWFPKFPQIFSSIADVVTVLGFLGVPSIPVYMVLVWAVGWTMGVDFFWVLALGPIASFAILGTVLCGVLLFRRGPKQAESLDLTRWVEHGSYFVWVAACLWSNQKPWPNIPADSPSYPMLQKLKGAIQTGQINVLSGDLHVRDVRRCKCVTYQQGGGHEYVGHGFVGVMVVLGSEMNGYYGFGLRLE